MQAETFTSWHAGVQQLQALVDIQSERRRKPNFFRIAPRMLRREGVHSDLVAWLLDPRGWHGLGDAFARLFIGETLRAAEHALSGTFEVTRVRTEVSTGKGPIDVLVELTNDGNAILFGIENKVDSPVDPDQLLRYARALVAGAKGKQVVLVLLTPTENADKAEEVRKELAEKVPACRFGAITYRNVIEALETALDAPRTDATGAGGELARHYLETLRMDIVPEPQLEIAQALTALYTGNKELWRLIRRELPSERDDSHIALSQAICGRLSAPAESWQFTLRPNGYARVFLSDWSKPFGMSQGDRIVGLAGEANTATHYPRVNFRLVVDAPEDEGDDRWHYTAKLRLDTRANPELGALLRMDLGKRLKDHERDKNPVTLVLGQTSRLPGIKDREVPDAVVEWFCEHMLPLVSLINRRLAPA